MLARIGLARRETKLVLLAGGCLALAGWADASLQNASETLFLKRVGVGYLPMAFLVSSLLMATTTYLIGRMITGQNRARLLPWIFALLSIALLPLWLLVYLDVPGSFVILILTCKQVKAIILLVFWIAMGDLLHGRDAKRLFAMFMAGFTLGKIGGSFASQPVAAFLGVEGLVYYSSGILALGALTALPLSRLSMLQGKAATKNHALDDAATDSPEERRSTVLEMWRESGLFRILLVSTVCAGMLAPMLHFQFAFAADAATAGNEGEAQLLGLYAQFRGWMNLAVLIAQLTLAARLYRRIGLPISVGLAPVFYLVGFTVLSLQPSLAVSIIMVSLTRLHDDAVYDPAMRVLYSLFPESLRARGGAYLEGPVTRLASVLGNLVVLGARLIGPAWAAYAALPIAAVWLVVSAWLWRVYPTLLMSAFGRQGVQPDSSLVHLLDTATVGVLSKHLNDSDRSNRMAAVDLLSEAAPPLAIAALATAIPDAVPDTREPLMAALDRQRNRVAPGESSGNAATGAVRRLLEDAGKLSIAERTSMTTLYGRLLEGGTAGSANLSVLNAARSDESPALRIATLGALCRAGAATAEAENFDQELRNGIHGDDPLTRQTAIGELHSLLLQSEMDSEWPARLHCLAEAIDSETERVQVAEALAEVALRHGTATRPIGDTLVERKRDDEPRIRAAVLRYVGGAQLDEHVSDLVCSLSSREHLLADAARDGLVAMGQPAANPLLEQYRCARPSVRQTILEILGAIHLDRRILHGVYIRELAYARRCIVALHGLEGGSASAFLTLRLEERSRESVHTALLAATAIQDEDRVAEVDSILRHSTGARQHAILLEALERLLGPEERKQLIPLLETEEPQARTNLATKALQVTAPSYVEALDLLVDDSDTITGTLAAAAKAGLDGRPQIDDHGKVLPLVEIALELRTIPMFGRLSTQQLIDLGRLVREEEHPEQTTVVREGEYGTCMYLIVSGEVEVEKEGRHLAVLGARDFFGDMAVLDGETRSANVVTRTNVELLRLEQSDLLLLMEENGAIAIAILQSLSQRLRQSNERPAQ